MYFGKSSFSNNPTGLRKLVVRGLVFFMMKFCQKSISTKNPTGLRKLVYRVVLFSFDERNLELSKSFSTKNPTGLRKLVVWGLFFVLISSEKIIKRSRSFSTKNSTGLRKLVVRVLSSYFCFKFGFSKGEGDA